VPTQAGDIIVSGYAAVWAGLDLVNENFARNAFQKSIPEFLSRAQRPLLWHHEYSKPLGQVLDLKEDSKGLWFKAIVIKQEPSSPLYYAYNAIRRGVARGVSVGGKFTREMLAGGQRIVKANLIEVSLTPAAMHQSTYLVASEVKSLRDWCYSDELDAVAAQLRELKDDMNLYELRDIVRQLRAS